MIELLPVHAGSIRRLALNEIMISRLCALGRASIEVLYGEEVTERTRAVRSPDEIRATRCASVAREAAMERFAREEIPRGGASEIAV